MSADTAALLARIEALEASNAALVRERDEWKDAAHDVDGNNGRRILWSDQYSRVLCEYRQAYNDLKRAEATISTHRARLEENSALIDLIREEAAKDNAPFGRADSLALDRIRTLTAKIARDGQEG